MLILIEIETQGRLISISFINRPLSGHIMTTRWTTTHEDDRARDHSMPALVSDPALLTHLPRPATGAKVDFVLEEAATWPV